MNKTQWNFHLIAYTMSTFLLGAVAAGEFRFNYHTSIEGWGFLVFSWLWFLALVSGVFGIGIAKAALEAAEGAGE